MWASIWAELSAAPLNISWTAVGLRLLAACLFGAMVGIEREWKNKAAGLRTHVMVSVGACLFALMAFEIMEEALAAGGSIVRADPVRLIEAVTAGIGFLAGGTILATKGHVTGLTTAAALWVVAAIGLACGIGQFGLAGLATLIVLIVLAVLRWVEPIGPKAKHRDGESSGDGAG